MPAADALLKKLSRSGAARLPLADPEALAAACARGCEDRLRPLLGAPVKAEATPPRIARLADATAALETPALIGLVAIEGAGVPVLIAADYPLAWHMTDLGLGGDPRSNPAPLPRALTALDLTLGRLPLDAIRQALHDALAAGLGHPPARAMRLDETRADLAELRLPPGDALTLRVALRLGAGRTGACLVLLPLAALDALRAPSGRAAEPAPPRPDDLWRRHMRRTAAASPVPLDAVLHRQTMTLAAVQALQVGQVLEIPRTAAETVTLSLPQPGGRSVAVATGQLGALRERKVVKLDMPPDPRLLQHVTAALRTPAAVPPPAPLEVQPAS
jgi:flagellar motor switch protein FliM